MYLTYVAPAASVDTSANVDLMFFFVVGLLGGAHCIGMCGPLVTLYSDRLRGQRDDGRDVLSLHEVRQHLVFNLGRTTSYAAIGGLFGVLGFTVFSAAHEVPAFDVVRAVLGVAVGAVVIAFGVYYVSGRFVDVVTHVSGVGVVFKKVHSVAVSHVDRWVDGPGVFGLGALHGLLPCPILYPAYLYVLVQAAPARGAASLAALGLGTIPAVFVFGTLIQGVSPRLRARLHRVLGVTLIALGYIPLSHGLMLLGFDVPTFDVPFHQPLGGHDH